MEEEIDMDFDDVIPGTKVVNPITNKSKEGCISKIKTRPYKIGDGEWHCFLSNGDSVPIKKLIKI